MKKIFLIISIIFSSFTINSQWVQTNGPVGGTISSVAFSGQNIFIGTDFYGGVFLSSNNGQSWVPTNLINQLENQSVQSLFVNGTSIYAGTLNGLYLTTNNGQVWVQTNLNNQQVYAILVSNQYIYAGTWGNGVYLSTNYGQTWSQTSLGGHITSFALIGNTVFAANDNGVYSSSNNGTSWIQTSLNNDFIWSLSSNTTYLYAGGFRGLYISTNNGQNWTTTLTNDSIYSVASSGSNVFAGTGNNVFRSTNHGLTWTQTGLNQYILYLAINGSNVYAGTFHNGIFMSNNLGQDWTQLSLFDQKINCLMKSGGNIFAGADNNGLFKTYNYGQLWNLSSLPNYYYVSSLFQSGQNILAGTQQHGVLISTNFGTSWVQSSLTLKDINAFAVDGSTIYAATSSDNYDGAVYKSTNNGYNWTNTNFNNQNVPNCLLVHGSSIFAGTLFYQGIFKSTDQGSSWTHITLNNNVEHIMGLVSIGSNIFAACLDSNFTTSGGVYLSSDNGQTWHLTSMTQPAWAITTSGSNLIISTYSNGIYISTNNGTTWVQKNQGMGNTRVISLLATDDFLYAGTQGFSVWKRPLCDISNGSCNTISGTITYSDNNQTVGGGFVKAIYYDRASSNAITVDSTDILANGTYALTHCPQDSVFIMVYQNDDMLDFVPTYYPSTIDWSQAVIVYPNQSQSNINVHVSRINNQNNPYSISGLTYNFNGRIDNAIVYAKIGNEFKNYGISIFNGIYNVDKLPPGNYNLTAYRIGYSSVSQNVIITNQALSSINFNLNNPIGISIKTSELPTNYSLYQNYPNPFNPTTDIKFDLPEKSKVSLKIFDITGKLVSELINETLDAGTHFIEFNGAHIASGVYFYKLETAKFNQTKKLVLLK